MKNIYLPKLAHIEEIKEETQHIRTFKMLLNDEEFSNSFPGQFVEITIFGYGEFPVAIAGFSNRENKYYLQTTIRQTGKVTDHIVDLTVGSTIGIRGPFGNGFPLDDMKGKNVCMITGGIGLTAINYLLDKLVEDRDQYGNLKLLHGVKNFDDLIYKDTYLFNEEEAKKVGLESLLAVENPDDRWEGYVGLVTGLLDKVVLDPTNTIAVVCGPGVMIKFVVRDLINMGFNEENIVVSLERRMQCGMGMCGHCMIGQKRVCIDGPVFSLNSIKNELEEVY